MLISDCPWECPLHPQAFVHRLCLHLPLRLYYHVTLINCIPLALVYCWAGDGWRLWWEKVSAEPLALTAWATNRSSSKWSDTSRLSPSRWCSNGSTVKTLFTLFSVIVVVCMSILLRKQGRGDKLTYTCDESYLSCEGLTRTLIPGRITSLHG